MRILGVYRGNGLPLLLVGPIGAFTVGTVVVRTPAMATAAACAAVFTLIVARYGTLWLTTLAAGAIPWAVTFGDLLPHGFRTTLAGAVALLLVLETRPLPTDRMLVWGAGALVLTVAASAYVSHSGEGHLEAERMVLFPLMAVALSGRAAPAVLGRMQRFVLVSSALALTTQIVLSWLGDVKRSSYYGVGEDLGLAQRPHELAFLAAMTACGAILVFKRGWLAISVFGVASYIAVDSGVRLGVLAIVAFVAVRSALARGKPRDLLIAATGTAIVMSSGAINVILNRLHVDKGGGLTNHRFDIWSNAWQHFTSGGPVNWLSGTGLGSVIDFSRVDLGLGDRGPAHSDLVAMGIQLGAIGLAAYLTIWLALIMKARYPAALVPVAIFAVANGVIDRTDAMVFALLIVGATQQHARRASSEEVGATTPQPDPEREIYLGKLPHLEPKPE